MSSTVYLTNKIFKRQSFLDCVDNFDENVFTYNECVNTNSSEPYKLLKCNDGKCYLNTAVDHANSCDNPSNKSFIGYHSPIYPSQDYWNNVILHKSWDMNETGHLVWNLVIALFISWIICFLCLFKGIKVKK